MSFNHMQIVLLHRFISDSVHFLASATKHFAANAIRLPDAAAGLQQQNTDIGSMCSSPGIQGSPERSQAKEQAASLQVFAQDTFLIVPEHSWAAESFGISIDEISAVPQADAAWFAGLVQALESECAFCCLPAFKLACCAT